MTADGTSAEADSDLPWGTLTTRADGTIVAANDRFASWVGKEGDALVGVRFKELLVPASRILHETHVAPLLAAQGFANEVMLDLASTGGARVPVLLCALRREAPGGSATHTLTLFDATATRRHEQALRDARREAEEAADALAAANRTLRAQHEQLLALTFTDRVTGLPNRLVLQDRLAQAVARCAESCRSLAVLFVDIDRFKSVVDRHGEPVARAVLQEIAARLVGSVPSTDTVTCVHGDQFVMVAEGIDGPADAAELASRVSAEVSRAVGPVERPLTLTASIGIALHPADGAADRLVAHADTAMVVAKQEGGDGHRFYLRSVDAEARARLDLLEALRRAPERGELRLHYQPKVHARSGQVTGVEALVRWERPGHGLVPPGVFVPLAEQSGLIDAIGRWVLAEACRQMGDWCRSGFRMRVAINLSAQQLRSSTLAADIATELARHGVDPALLTCEITESVAMGDATDVLESARRLRDTGIRMSIDDFGTGYSSLAYLRKLPIDELKIDRSFVVDLASSEDARVLVSAIVNLAHSLRFDVVAEGVETREQHDILLETGCDLMQGYLWSKPMAAEALHAWAQRRGEDAIAFRPSIFAPAA